jgi:hypothetical protein
MREIPAAISFATLPSAVHYISFKKVCNVQEISDIIICPLVFALISAVLFAADRV